MFRKDFSETERELYWQGARDALTAFAVWRDGTQWVNDMRTLNECLKYIKKEIEYSDSDPAQEDQP